jgi:hypothetical protein
MSRQKWNSLVVALALAPLESMAFDPVPPAFPLQQGWLGGDRAYSVPLGASNRTVWLFGETYVRDDSVLSRQDAATVANTVAIRTSDGTNQTINYFWQNQDTSTPDAFFSSGTDQWQYWPEDGFTNNGELYVCLARVQTFGPGAAAGFQVIGVDLARISDPQDPPLSWQITYNPLASSGDIFPGVSTVVNGDYVYLFSVEENYHWANWPVFLARVPLSALDSDPGANLEYLAWNNTWQPGPIGQDAMEVMDHGQAEMTVRFHPDRNRWVAVQSSDDSPSRYIWRRQAPDLAGPWSAPVSLYSIPEYDRWNSQYGRDRYYYGGKEHTEFLNPTNGNGVVTYVGDSFDEWDVEGDLGLYVPEEVALAMDPVPSGTYHGLFQDTNEVTALSSGSATLTTTWAGPFSGALQLGNARYGFSGWFDSSGAATLTIPRHNASDLTIALQIDYADGGDHIDGTVTDGFWTATLGADRALFNGHIAIAPQAGKYTLALPGANGSSSLPAGDGFGTFTVDNAGSVHFSGRLADGTSVSQSATLSWTGQWPLYLPLYGGQGCLVGWVSVPGGTKPVAGSVTWVKPALAQSKYYPGGFTLPMAVNGSAYFPPWNGAPILDFANATVIFTGGDLSQGITNSISFGVGNHVINLGPSPLSLSFSASSGTFSGRVVSPSNGQSIAFQGVVLQGQESGFGYFLGPDQSGLVVLSAPVSQ